MRKLTLSLGVLVVIITVQAQTPSAEANYQLASRYSPKKLEKMLFSTSVDPHWLKNSTRFWYSYETPNGKSWYLVDPAKADKRLLFDNAKMAAQLTNLVKFQLTSTQNNVIKDTTAKKGTPPKTEKKKYYFVYNINNGQLVQLTDFKRPSRTPRWASVSPDQQTIVFVRNFNLFWMDKSNYEKALKNEDDSTIVEHAITKDGIEYFSYSNEGI